MTVWLITSECSDELRHQKISWTKKCYLCVGNNGLADSTDILIVKGEILHLCME